MLLTVLVLAVAQFLLVAASFPLGELLSRTPLFHIDGAFHWYQIEFARRLAQEGRVVGYDPYFAAGYVGGVTYNWSAKAPALLSILMGNHVSAEVAYKIFVFFASIATPLSIPLATRLLRLPTIVTIAASMLGLVLWWNSYFRWYQTAGLVSYVTACYLSVAYLAALYRFTFHGGGNLQVLALGLCGAGLFFLHPAIPVFIAAGYLGFFLSGRKPVSPTTLPAAAIVIAGLSLIPNLVWIWPMYKYGMLSGHAALGVQPYMKDVDASLLWREFIGMLSGSAHGSKLNPIMGAFAVLGTLKATAQPARRVARDWLVAAVVVELFADLGAAIPFLAAFQPNRFGAAGYLLLAVPAGIGIHEFTIGLRNASSKISRAGYTLMAGVATACLLFFIREIAHEALPGNRPRVGAPPPETRQIGPRTAVVLSWLRRNTTPDARVLFETSVGRIYDDAHTAGYLALRSNREFIGGPYPYSHFAGYWDDRAFGGRKLRDIGPEQFMQYVELYNIGWVIAFSDSSKRFLAGIPAIQPTERFGIIQTYRIDLPHSFFDKGSGSITARAPNRLDVHVEHGSDVILKYHYVPGMRIEPAGAIRPVFLGLDPQPFIEALDVPADFRLSMQ
jgi:hypothetical protein